MRAGYILRRTRPQGHQGRSALLRGRRQPPPVRAQARQHQDRQHPSGRAHRAQSLHTGHFQNAHEPDQGLPPGRRKDHRKDLYLLRLQIPHRPAHPHERQPAPGRADRPGGDTPDPLPVLLRQKAGACMFPRADPLSGRKEKTDGGGARRHFPYGQALPKAHRRPDIHQFCRADPGQSRFCRRKHRPDPFLPHHPQGRAGGVRGPGKG